MKKGSLGPNRTKPEECLWAQFKRIRVTQADQALLAEQRPETREKKQSKAGF